jgi:excisionase family DNA binding protein
MKSLTPAEMELLANLPKNQWVSCVRADETTKKRWTQATYTALMKKKMIEVATLARPDAISDSDIANGFVKAELYLTPEMVHWHSYVKKVKNATEYEAENDAKIEILEAEIKRLKSMIDADPEPGLKAEGRRLRGMVEVDPEPKKNQLLDIEGCADMLQVKKSWIYDKTRKGEIPHIKMGKYLRFDENQLSKWLKEKSPGLT